MRSAYGITLLVLASFGCRPEAPPPGYAYPYTGYPAHAPPPGYAPQPGYAPVAPAPTLAPPMPALPSRPPDAVGRASYYADSLAGNTTANGEIYDPQRLTAAHRKLPFGTVVDVRRVDTGAMVRVRINDRGPFGDARRIIDLSRRAAETLNMMRAGVVDVELRIVSRPR